MSLPKSNNSDAVAIRKHLRERILDDVLGMFNSFNEEEEEEEEEGFSPSSTLEWRVLILDDVTTKVVSSAVGMADLMAERSITSVESILKSREPQPEREAIYFISPTNEKAVKALIKDWDVSETNNDEEEVNNNENEKKKKKKKLTLFGGGNKKNNNEHNNKKKESKKKPTKPYRAAHVFFSSPAQRETLQRLKQNTNLIRHLKTCKEVYAEFQVNDSRSFSVDYAGALPALFGERGRILGECVDACSTRLSTMLSTIGELNANIRYKKGVMNEDGEIIGRNACEAVARQTEYLLSKMREKKSLDEETKKTNGSVSSNLGKSGDTSTCEVLVLDRSFDYVAPIIHEWTYEAIIHDLLNVPNSVYTYSINTNKGVEEKIAKLDEKDALYVELRHAHVAKVMGDLFEKGRIENEASQKNTSNSDIKRMVQALPETLARRAKLSIHTSIAAELNHVLNVCDLASVGRMEQMVAFGEATSKDIIQLLSSPPSNVSDNLDEGGSNAASTITIEQTLPAVEKLRLLMIYAATHPEKIDEQEALKWIRASGLTQKDIDTVLKLEQLGAKIRKTDATTSKSTRMNRPRVDERLKATSSNPSNASFDRFIPRVAAMVRELDGNALSLDGFPSCSVLSSFTNEGKSKNGDGEKTSQYGVNNCVDDDGSKSSGSNLSTRPQAKLGRWALHARNGSAIPDIPSRTGTPDSFVEDELESKRKTKKKRIIIFVLGGVTRGEIREGFHLSEELDRDVFIGGTSILNPETFIGDLMSIEGSLSLQSTKTRIMHSASPPPDVSHEHLDPVSSHSHLQAQSASMPPPEVAKSPQMDPKELEKLLSGLENL